MPHQYIVILGLLAAFLADVRGKINKTTEQRLDELEKTQSQTQEQLAELKKLTGKQNVICSFAYFDFI